MAKDETFERRVIKRRRVLYVHGFDPATSERYRRLLARAGTGRAGPPPAMTPVDTITEISDGWRITAEFEGERTETVFEVLRYEDIVRQWRNRALHVRLATGLASWFGFVTSGGLRRTFAVAKGPAALFFYPILMLALFIGLGVFAGRMVGELAEYFGAPDWSSQIGRLIGAAGGLWLSVALERAFFSHLMLALFDFLFRIAGGKPPSGRMGMRIEQFAKRIVECVDNAHERKVDEILIVGHSLGALIAVRSLARAMEMDVDLTGGCARVGLLTLGSVAGYVTCRGGPGADELDDEVARLAVDHDLAWVDISSPRDRFSFGLVDPLLLVRNPPLEARSPQVLSAKFGKAISDPEDKRTRFAAMSLHMKYLGAPDQRGAFDFLAVAAGPRSLAERFADRRNSPKAKMLNP